MPTAFPQMHNVQLNMQFVNFDLEQDVRTTTLRGLGGDWDLHNCADFQGFTYNTDDDMLLLRWVAMTDPDLGCVNPWGNDKNEVRSCGLRFSRLKFMQLTYPPSQQVGGGSIAGLSAISRTAPGKGELGFRSKWSPREECHLLFEFDDGRAIEIGAEAVELVINP